MAGVEKWVGGIAFGVSMSTQKLVKDVSKARKVIGGFVSSVSESLFSLKGLFAGIVAGATVYKFVDAVRDAAESLDELGDAADNLNVSSQALAGLQYAAEQSGASSEMLQNALFKIGRATWSAAAGTGAAADAYAALGLNARELTSMTPDKQFMAVADAVSRLNDSQQQLAVTQAIFGRSSGQLVETLRLGSAGLREMQGEAANLGIALDDSSVKGVQRAMDAFKSFKMAVGGIFASIAAEVAPLIEGLSVGMRDFLATGSKGKNLGANIGKWVQNAAVTVVSLVQKLVQFGFKTFAYLYQGVLDFRASFMGQSMGMADVTQQEIDDLNKSIEPLNKALFETDWAATLGKGITESVASAQKAAEEGKIKREQETKVNSAVAQNKALMEGAGAWLSNKFGQLQQKGTGSAMDMLGAAKSKALKGLSAWGANYTPTPKAMNTQSIGLMESGSAESYRQRVRIQDQGTKVYHQKSLSFLGQIAKNTANGSAQLATANLGA